MTDPEEKCSPVVEVLSLACICCQETAHTEVYDGLERCTACGHIRALLDWTPEMFHELYTTGYFKGGEYEDYEEEGDALRYNFRKRLKELKKRHPDGGDLWEIGCAYGFFLEAAGKCFNAAGCDIARDAVASAVADRDVKAQCLNFLEKEEGGPYDVICLWDTIEHLSRPDLYLEKAFSELKEGGTLALSTGDIGSRWARLRGRHWRLIHPPTHVHYFTPASLEALLMRLGYSDVEFRYPPFWRNVHNTVVKLSQKHAFFSLFRPLTAHTPLGRINFPLNLFDLMTVYARKK
jgi:SAM-dependent methyltransferase